MLWFFCFKQKTAYEMRISDWSSDVCSSDLTAARFQAGVGRRRRRSRDSHRCGYQSVLRRWRSEGVHAGRQLRDERERSLGDRGSAYDHPTEIGRASCRERVCQYVEISVVAVSLKKKKQIYQRDDIVK